MERTELRPLDIFVMQVFNGVSLFTILLLMAMGLAIVFGLMGVINMAHGELMALGAYVTYLTAAPSSSDHAAGVDGRVPVRRHSVRVRSHRSLSATLLERGFIRFFYHRPLDTLLATWGLSLILQQTYRSIFGAQEVSVPLPSWLSRRVGVTGHPASAQPHFHHRPDASWSRWASFMPVPTRWGLRVRAVTQNRADEPAVGIDTNRVDALIVCLGRRPCWHRRLRVHHGRFHQPRYRPALHRRRLHRRRVRRRR
jgi:urea transport system permease protein